MLNKIAAVFLIITIAAPSSGGMYFDNNYVDYSATLSVEPSTGLTISYWIYTSRAAYSIHVQKFENSANKGWLVYQTSDGSLRFGMIIDGAWKSVTVASPDIENKYIHIAATFDGTTLRLYKNGVQIGETAYSGTITAATTKALSIGNSMDADTNYYLEGYVDDMRIYNRASTVGEIESLAMSRSKLTNTGGLVVWSRLDEVASGTASGAGTVLDRSGNGNTGTPTGNPTWQLSTILNYP